MVYTVMAYIVMIHIANASIVMAYIVMARVVMVCSGVLWTVLKTVQTVSPATVESFAFKGNFRPPQPLEGRKVVSDRSSSITQAQYLHRAHR